MNHLFNRLLRTESLALIFAFGLVVTDRVSSVEEALAIGASVAGFVVSRGLAKMGNPTA